MLIGLVRHGKTDWNAKGIIQGQTDIPLNEEGIGQAKALALRLGEDEPLWNAVISSDLGRARTTAQLIAEKLDIPLLAPDERLRERYFGEIEGTTEAERLARWGETWRSRQLGVESDETLRARGNEAIKAIAAANPDSNVLIVSHGSFIAQMLMVMCSGLEDQRLGNLSYSILERSEDGWRALLHNCTKHLDQ